MMAARAGRLVALVLVAGCALHRGPREQPGPPVADFADRVGSYVALHRRCEATLPRVTSTGDRAALEAHQQALAACVLASVPDRHPGKIFTPEVAASVRARLADATAGKAGKHVRGAIRDDNPTGAHVAVLAPYPEGRALSTVPATVLAALPPVPEELEYRFVGRTLILRDVGANLVVDVLPDALR